VIRLLVYTSELLNALALDVLFSKCADIRLVSVVSDAEDLYDQVASTQPDVVLLSIATTQEWSLLNATQRLAATAKVVLWIHEITVPLAHRLLETGVHGLLRKSLAPDMILRCVRKVYGGELWIEQPLIRALLTGRAVKISRREGQLIALVSQGLKNKEIASVMSITEGSVKVYLSRLFVKIGAKDRRELALLGQRNGQNDGSVPGVAPHLTSVFLNSDTGSDSLPVLRSAAARSGG
jgi:DNA-binding NarL/FixJ family response regulator